MFSKLQNEIVKLREEHSQIEVAQILRVSQADISKIEKTIQNKIAKAIFLLDESEKNETLFRRKFKSNPLQNALFILPYIKLDYEITGITAQFLLTNYYELSNEVEIRTTNPLFSELWGSKVLESTPGPLYLIRDGLHIALFEKILLDCIERKDLAGLKSGMAMLLNYRMDFSFLSNLMNDAMKKRYDQIVQALKINLEEYNIKLGWSLSPYHEPQEIEEDILFVSRKIIDDFAPFLEYESK